MEPERAFTGCYRAFCSAIKTTFPELAGTVQYAEAQVPTDMHITKFWTAVAPVGQRILASDETLLRDSAFHVLPGVSLSSVWDSLVTDDTRTAVWKYIHNLYRLAEILKPTSKETVDTSNDKDLVDDEDAASSGISALLGMGEDMSNNIAKIQDVFTRVANAAMDPSGESTFTIPEELRDSTLFKLVQELVSELNPKDLGLDSVEDMSPEQALTKLVEMHEKNPDKIFGLLKRVAGKLQTRIQGGSLTRDVLLEDAKKFIVFLESNETLRSIAEPLKEVFGSMAEKFQHMTGQGSKGRPGGAAGATTVRDRLRRMAEKRRADSGVGATATEVPATVAAAEASIDELVREIESIDTRSKAPAAGKKTKRR